MTARIRVESGGRVVSDAEASGELDARHGSFVLLPTAPDLLAALRQPPEGGRSKAPRVVLIGDAPRHEGLPGTGMPITDSIHYPNALTIANMGYRRLKRGESDDLMTLTPLYIGRSAAEEKRLAGIKG
jgi:hypothetical protein